LASEEQRTLLQQQTNGSSAASSSQRRKKTVRICEASNRVHACVVDNANDDSNDDDDGTAAAAAAAARWYQPSDYAQFRAAAVRQLSAWMSAASSHSKGSSSSCDSSGSSSRSSDSSGSSDSSADASANPTPTPIPRGLEPLYHRAVLQSSKQRQMYSSLIVWKHRVLAHRHRHQRSRQGHENDRAGACCSVLVSAEPGALPAAPQVEVAIRELSEPLTEPDRVRAYRMAQQHPQLLHPQPQPQQQ
jgi:hypothetical protein